MDHYIVGIDFGMHNSYVAVCSHGVVEIITDENGFRATPSWVAFERDIVFMGKDAMTSHYNNGYNTIYEVKRFLGKKVTDPDIQEELHRLPFSVANDMGILKINIKCGSYSPEEIVAFILKKLKASAEARLHDSVTKAVLTVPTHFSGVQKQSLKNAAFIAGFTNTAIINEPIAAASAFHHKSGKNYNRHVLVYNFARTTVDVSVVAIKNGKCEVRSTKRDPTIGGNSIDENFAQLVKEDLKQKFGKNANDINVKLNLRRIKHWCKYAKKKLFIQSYFVFDIDDFCGLQNYTFKITRSKFYHINKEVFDRTLQLVDECIQESQLQPGDIDEVFPTGGSSKIPKVQRMLEDYFGKDIISRAINPKEAVAYGAAVYAETFRKYLENGLVHDDFSLEPSDAKKSKPEEPSTVFVVNEQLSKVIRDLEIFLDEIN